MHSVIQATTWFWLRTQVTSLTPQGEPASRAGFAPRWPRGLGPFGGVTFEEFLLLYQFPATNQRVSLVSLNLLNL